MRARDNPFRSERLATLQFRPFGLSFSEIETRLKTLNWRAAVVGPHGTGKSTFLRMLGPMLNRAGFRVRHLRLSEEAPRFPGDLLPSLRRELEREDFILLDGAEQMNRVGWARFRWATKAAGGLVITTHYPGRLPTLFETCSSPELIHALVEELVPNRPSAAEGARLYQAHGGNVREALRELYDIYSADQAVVPR